jgi:branched-chain amino acid transport system ATP-binding protein
MLNSLVMLLLLRIGGVNTATGAFLGGMVYALFPILQQQLPSLPNLAFLLTGVGAISVGRDPNGMGGRIAAVGERLRERWRSRREPSPAAGETIPTPARPAGERPATPLVGVEPSGAKLSSDGAAVPKGEPLLEVDAVSVRFGGLVALADVDLTADAGRVTGLIGPNGAGKTTLFNVVGGLVSPTSGRVRVAGLDVSRLSPHRRARLGVARTFQRLEVFGSLTARENVQAAVEFRQAWLRESVDPRAATDEILELVGLSGVADQPVDAMPTGLARLVELGRALGTRPRLLLLDEPGSGLSQEETDVLADLLVRLGRTGMAVLLVEHDMELVMRVCDRIHVLDFGRMIAVGSAREIRADPSVQAAYLGDESVLEEVVA